MSRAYPKMSASYFSILLVVKIVQDSGLNLKFSMLVFIIISIRYFEHLF